MLASSSENKGCPAESTAQVKDSSHVSVDGKPKETGKTDVCFLISGSVLCLNTLCLNCCNAMAMLM